MQSIKTIVHPENRQVEINLTAFIPMAEIREATKEEIDNERIRRQALAYDIIEAFSKLIIESLKRRMQACQQNLLAHITDAKAYSENIISWVDKRGMRRDFSVNSMKTMENTVKGLSQSDWACLYKNRAACDQVLKALLNDTIQDHEDKGGFHYSELVSLLCECHASHYCR